jgi:endogenous inhibitor of DNA gyrase (YacG/DUF329 family)
MSQGIIRVTRYGGSSDRVGQRRIPVRERGRRCAEPYCGTILSVYNPSPYCCLHERRGAARVRRRDEKPLVEKKCAHDECGRTFESANPNRVYCSDRCRMAAFARRRSRAHAAARRSQLREATA